MDKKHDVPQPPAPWVPNAAWLRESDPWWKTSRFLRSCRAFTREWHRPTFWSRKPGPNRKPVCTVVNVAVGVGGGGGASQL